MRPSPSELCIYNPDGLRIRVRCEPASKPEPYHAVYAVVHCKDDPATVFDFETVATFPGCDAERALDFAENHAKDAARCHVGMKPTAIVVNNERGVEQGRFPVLGLVGAATAPESRRVSWLWRMLGYKG